MSSLGDELVCLHRTVRMSSLGDELVCLHPTVRILTNYFPGIRININYLGHVYMRPEVNSNWFEISNCFEMSFRLHGNLYGDFTAATF